jgi:RNA polymerase sigma-54 factor
MKLLQIPTANLEERIKEELEENPALEVGEEDHEDRFEEQHTEDFDGDDEEYDGSEDEYENIDISDYVSDSDDEVADYKLRDDNYGDNEEQKTVPLRVETTLHDLLIDQLGMLSLDERRYKIAEQIVGSIDDDGYLTGIILYC